MSTIRDWIDKLSSKIPGYSGYTDREQRRDMDKLHRESLANRLRAIKAPLTDVMKDLSNNGRLLEVTPVDTAIKKLDKIENRIRFASYGYAGFFDAVRIEQPQLDMIYRFVLSLVEQVEKLEAEVGELAAGAGTAAGLKDGAAKVTATIDALDRSFDERYRAINEFGNSQPGQAPGRPLFS